MIIVLDWKPYKWSYKPKFHISKDHNPRVVWKIHDEIISAVDDLLMDLSTATLIKEVCGPQGKLYWKINHICTHSMTVSWSAYELFSQPL